jgi:hypothetical protein
MPIGGFEGPSCRRVCSVERALSASTLLPTVAFAALGAVTVLLVAQMGISPLGAVVGPSARDGGHAVTTPRMSISIGPPRLHRSAPARDRETTTADSPTGPTTLTFARPVAHTIPPTRGRETTAADAQSAAFTAAVTGVAVTNAAVIDAAVTTWEVTTAAVGRQAQADMGVMVASEVMYTVLARPAMAPTTEPEDHKSQKSLKSQNEDTSVTSVKTTHTTQSTDTAEASEHAKAAKSGS